MHRSPRGSLWDSFRVAGRGFFEAAAGQRNMRLHLLGACLVLAAGCGLGVSRFEWLILIGCIGSVLTMELINTALETVVDLACPEPHELARQAKDFAAAAVLVCAVTAAVIGGTILLPRLYQYLAA